MRALRRHHNDGLRKICGCERRTWPKCPHPWHLNYTYKGKVHRLSLDREVGKHIDSKTAAEAEAERIRIAIRDGTFRRGAPVLSQLTLAQLFGVYVDRRLDVVRPDRATDDQDSIRVITAAPLPLPTGEVRPFGAWLVPDITADTLERFREVRIARGGGSVAVNRNLSFLRAMFNWAIRTKYVPESPFKVGTETVVKLTKESARSRRLLDGEEGKILAACGPHLRAVVEAALETGCRLGELFSLQWNQIRGDPFTALDLPASKTKTRRDRTVPITARLRAILDMRKTDPAGERLPADAFVFGTEIGTPVLSIKTAWMRAVLKAHGVTPETTKATKNLTAECRAAFRRIDLHFHDLRREAASRWLEGGVSLAVIKDWLGHTSIAQTSTYLASTAKTQADAMKQFEARRVALHKLASSGKTRGRKRRRTAGTRERKPKETAINRGQTVM